MLDGLCRKVSWTNFFVQMQSRKRRRLSVKTEELEIVKLSDVELQKVQWLWKPYIPFGKITIIQGDRQMRSSTEQKRKGYQNGR